MNNLASDDQKEQIRNATEIVDLIGGYLNLRRQGRLFVGSCPWHDDSRPSLQVNPDRQSWKCWVCDIGGDVFSFVMKRESLEFREALEMLADRAGIVLQKSERGPSSSDKNALFKVLAWAERQFADFLAKDTMAAPRASTWPIAESVTSPLRPSVSDFRPTNGIGCYRRHGMRLFPTNSCSWLV